MLGAVMDIDGIDPSTGQSVTLRAASHDDPRVCHLDGKTWWPMLAKLPTLRLDFFDGAFGDQITAPTSSFTTQTEAWPDFGRYALADARTRLWTGEIGAPWSAWTLRFDGRLTEQPEVNGGAASATMAVDDRWLDTPFLATYAGTTGAEGALAMKGQVKPLALGAPRYVPGVLIDTINSVFQVSAYGGVQGIDVALERLSRFGAPIADYPTYAALVAATVPKGTWATANAVGMARFGAPPSGTISFLMRGDQAGPDGWARKPGQIIRRIALLAGGAGRIDDASLAALDAARPFNQSIYIDQQTTARDLIQQIAASVNAVALVSWVGKLMVLPIGIGAPSLTLAADGTALPPVADVKRLAIAAPFKKLAMGAERTWAVHAVGDIAFTAELVPMGDYAPGTTYREGNIVQYDGGTWLYVNPTPTAGNTPADGAFWTTLAAKGEPGTGKDGAPGTNNATIPIYQRSASGAPPLPSAVVTYTYASAGISGLNNGWTPFVIPAGTDPVYASAATASSTSGTDTIQPNEWAAARQVLRNGDTGASGLNVKSVEIYQRAASAPPLPSLNATYTFSTSTLANLNNGWSATFPPNDGRPLYVSTATALTPTDVDNINPSEWAAAQILVEDGGKGDEGEPSIAIEPSAASVTFFADYLGTLKANQLSQTVRMTFNRGTVDVSASTAWSVEGSGCTPAISAAGVVSFSAVTADGEIRVTGIHNGVTRTKKVPITVAKDNAPASEETKQSRTVDIAVAVDQFGSFPTSGTVSVRTGPTGTIKYDFSGSYNAVSLGNVTLQGIFAYRAAGSNDPWTYLTAGAVTGTRARYIQGADEGYIDDPGSLTISQAQGGLTPNALYDTGLFLRRFSGNVQAGGAGTMTVTGS